MTRGTAELGELLRRAGLEVVGERRVQEVPSPRFAWRATVPGDAERVVRVAGDRADPIGEFNAQWHRLAVAGGILDEDGVFLIDIADHCTGSAPWDWTPVRLTDRWDLAGVLGERPGEPKFVALSTDGDSLLGTTSEDDGIRLVVVDRMRERREAAARATARETPEERAVAWESAVAGLDPSGRLLTSWANGLALNPATPDDLRAGLQGRSTYLKYSAMPTAVVEAAMVHPDWQIRAQLAEAQPNITADQWIRLILAERNERHRWILTMLAADRRVELTGPACERLAVDPSARVRAETARLSGLSAHLLTVLAADPEWTVRAAACRRAWPHLPSGTRHKLLGDPSGKVRAQALLRHHQDHPMPRSVFLALATDFASDTADGGFQDRAVKTCRLERELAEHLAHHGDPALRRSLAGSPGLDPDLVALLGRDQDESVRFAVSTRPDLTEEQRVGIDIDFDPRLHHCPLDWVTDLHGDPAALRRLAASAHPLVRRSVARVKRLPPDVVELLARDEDRVVQLFLAESCDDAPPDMLLRVWQWWTGSLSAPDRPHGHPNFPRHDLLRHADDPNPRMRQLALDDPESTPELVERFSRDPDEEVRYRAAKDPRLTAASAVRLLDDPHGHIRHAAFWHARFPARVVVRLLRDPDTAEPAARHPSLPVPVMQRMLQLLQLHPPLS
ncbi:MULTISPECIES: PE-PGRS family protein [Streptomyces]|uniref:PE-PGRS family protein n=1 Tax=Streptomyces TaxID=1883 RepID=UPI0029B68B48|nr:PE-PGRS family protein [Streptomyces sp. AK02-04a]MDX3754232.1 PE-PGRS family protein [Streptomyces sp. AK02-04a]